MGRFSVALAAAVSVSVFAAACGGGGEQNEMGNMPAPAPAAPAASGEVEVTLTTTPNPPMTGENTFEVMVMSGGQPVTDGDVSVEFFMPAMGNMAEMRNTIPLTNEGGGRYRGMGNVMMAGDWDATVMVMRGGQTIGSQTLKVTAK